MATRNMRYRKRHYGLLDEETSFQIDRALRIAAQGRERAIRCDRKYETNAARQKAYRARLKARHQPLTEEQWRMVGEVFVSGLAGHTPLRRQLATLAFNALLRCHRAGLVVELSGDVG